MPETITFPVHSPKPWITRRLTNGKVAVVKAFRDRPLNGECPVWAMLNPDQRQSLYRAKFQ